MSGAAALLELLQKALPGGFAAAPSHCGEVTLVVSAAQYLPLLRWLRDNGQIPFDLFVDLFGMDNLPAAPRFEVIVHLFSSHSRQTLRVRAKLDGDPPHLPSLVPLYPGAAWAEREAFDNFGIQFDGHPDLRRILNAADIEFHPLRKDFPLKHYRD